MLSPELYKSSSVYNFFMKSLGYERSIDRYLGSVVLSTNDHCRILDAGCGTGMLGLHFAQRLPLSRLLFTDLEPNFLQETLRNARKRGIDERRIQVGIANISAPHLVTGTDGSSSTLGNESFDIICVGAVLGYADDTEEAVRQLVRMLAPGGTLINIEMNESPTGRFVARRYHYTNIPLSRMQNILRAEGCSVTAEKLNILHLPAKFTRTAIIAHKPQQATPRLSPQ